MSGREKLLAAAIAVSSALAQVHDVDSTADAERALNRRHLHTLAFEILQFRDRRLQFATLHLLLTPEFVTLSLMHIRSRGSYWEYLVVRVLLLSSATADLPSTRQCSAGDVRKYDRDSPGRR